jgi:hypothetical protein
VSSGAVELTWIKLGREALQAVPDARGGDLASVRQVVARLDRMAAEAGRIELAFAGQAVAALDERS